MIIEEAAFLDSWSIAVPGKTGKETRENKIERALFNESLISLHETVREVSDAHFLFLGETAVSEVSLFEWTEFIELLKQDSGWLEALSMGIEIYSGNRKGFTDVPQ